MASGWDSLPKGKLKKMRLAGSAPQTLCDAAIGLGAAWGPDNTIYFVPFGTGGVWKVPATGGVGQPLTTLDRGAGEVSHRWPQVLPGGQAVIFTVWTGPGADERQLQLQMLSTGERRTLLRGASTGRYVASGHLLVPREDAVMVVPFDLATLQLTGQPLALGERVLDDEGAHYSVSESGTLAYVPTGPQRFERRLVWVDSRGTVEPVPSPLRPVLRSDDFPGRPLCRVHQHRTDRDHLDPRLLAWHADVVHGRLRREQPGGGLDP